jgi:hypothetical protein
MRVFASHQAISFAPVETSLRPPGDADNTSVDSI